MLRNNTPEQDEMPKSPTYLKDMNGVLEELDKFGEAHLLLGFGSTGQYQDVEDVVRRLTDHLNTITKPWLLVYGGDKADENAPDVGLLAKRIAEGCQCKVLATMVKQGQEPAPESFIHYHYMMDPQYEDELEGERAAGSESSRDADVDAGAASNAPLGGGAGGSSTCGGRALLGKRRHPEATDGAALHGASASEGPGGDAEGGVGGDAGRRQRSMVECGARKPGRGQPAEGDAVADLTAVADGRADQEAKPPPGPAGGSVGAHAAFGGKGSGDGGGSGSRRILWGGIRNGRPVGVSAMYLDDRLIVGSDDRRRITSVLCAGGGNIAREELEYIDGKGVTWIYFRSKPKNRISGSGEFGPVDQWVTQHNHPIH